MVIQLMHPHVSYHHCVYGDSNVFIVFLNSGLLHKTVCHKSNQSLSRMKKHNCNINNVTIIIVFMETVMCL